MYQNDGDAPVRIFDQLGASLIVHDNDLYDCCWNSRMCQMTDDDMMKTSDAAVDRKRRLPENFVNTAAE